MQEENLVLERDMVMEEVDSDWEQQQVEEGCLLDTEQEKQAEAQMEDQIHNTTPNILITQQEDAETQTERWTPLIENIRREAEEAALVSMQERYGTCHWIQCYYVNQILHFFSVYKHKC